MLPCRVTLASLLAVVLSWALTSPVEAAPQAFVSVSGDDFDRNPGDTADPNTINLRTNCDPVWPCRTITRALAAVDAGGEVVVLSSGDYQPFVIRRSVSVVTAPGVHAVITATDSNAITINAAGAIVALRGLTLNGLGGQTGISVLAVDFLEVEECVLSGFNGNAIAVLTPIAGSRFHISDTTVRDSGGCCASAIFVDGASGLIDRVRMDHNRHGLVIDLGVVTIRDSVAAHQIQHAVWVRGHGSIAFLTIENCMITVTELGSGIIAGDPDPSSPAATVFMFVSNSTITGNATGITSFVVLEILGAIWVSNTTIALNQTGIVPGCSDPPIVITPIPCGGVRSRGNNMLEGNRDNGSFSKSFSAK